jgi:hypothetical protein
MWPVALIFAACFAIFAAVEWAVIAGIPWRSIGDIFDLVFVLFQAFWVLGWSVGVAILGMLTILFSMYSESARLQDRTLVRVPRLGPIAVLVEYDLAKIRNIRLERAISNAHPDAVRVRFDYGGGTNTLGDTMPRAEGQRLVDTIAGAAAAFPSMPATERPAPPPAAPPVELERLPPASSISVLALVVANMLPLLGVLLFGWDMSAIMMLFWAESGVIAFYTVLKMAVVGKAMALLAAPFFIGHFGGFMAVHFLFIYMFFLRGTGGGPTPNVVETLRAVFIPLWTSIAALFISHGISFFSNFIGRREYAAATLGVLMNSPYSRIVVMQIALIFGGWIVMTLKSPVGALVLLIVLKTSVDLRAHLKERARMRTAATV